MAGNPREHVKGKGFWDGGASGRSENGQSAGRPSGYPGSRTPSRLGYRSDLEFPEAPQPDQSDSKSKP
jgi:hypothetical protein